MTRQQNRWIILGILVLSLILVGVGLALVLRHDDVPARSVLRIDLTDKLPEEGSKSPLARLLGGREATVLDIQQALEAAHGDTRIEAVLLHLAGVKCGPARAQEVRAALARYRAAGGRVVAQMERGGITDYYIAAAADEIHLVPAGGLSLTGIALEVPFVRGALDSLGIYPDFEETGADKNAPQVYTQKEMPARMREVMQHYADDLHARMRNDLAADRGLDVEAMGQLMDLGYFAPAAALEAGLVDSLSHAPEVLAQLQESAGGEIEEVSVLDYLKARAPGWLSRPPRVAVVYAVGTIVSGDSVDNDWAGHLAGSDSLTRILRQVREDDGVKGVVLRIDSPGGSSVASDVIWREVKRTADVKPVVVSMGDYAASGGYFIASAAHEVVAQPSTFTGSIGAFSGKFAMRGFWEWIGFNWVILKAGRNDDMFHELDPWTDEQRQRVRLQLASIYERFLAVVSEGRKMDVEILRPLATGRVFSGEEAMELGLVDRLGGLGEALDAVRLRAGLQAGASIRVDSYPRAGSWLQALRGGMTAPTPAAAAPEWVSEAARWQALTREGAAYYCPYRLLLN